MSNQIDLLSQGSFFAQTNKEIEEIVLATFISYPDTYYYYANLVSVTSFEAREHKEIYTAIIECGKTSIIDLITVRDKLIEKGYVQYYLSKPTHFDLLNYIDEICDRVNTDENIKHHIAILNNYTKRRGLTNLSTSVMQKVNEMIEPEDIIAHITQCVLKVQEINDASEFDLNKSLSQATHDAETGTVTSGIKSNFPELDNFIVKWDYGNLIIIAGPAGMGKTSFALELVRRSIIIDDATAVFSLEMRTNELITKMISSQAEIPLNTIRRKQLSQEQWGDWHQALAKIQDKPLYIDDKSRDIYKIGNKIKQLVIKHGVRRFIIDYLQLINIDLGNKSNREQEIAKISRYLKELANEMDIVIIALSQLNREVAKRANKRPVLSDLRESGAIEQDADFVIFVYRETYYNVDGPPTEIEEAEIIIAKGRTTGPGNIKVQYQGSITKFKSQNDYYGYQKAYKSPTPENSEENIF